MKDKIKETSRLVSSPTSALFPHNPKIARQRRPAHQVGQIDKSTSFHLVIHLGESYLKRVGRMVALMIALVLFGAVAAFGGYLVAAFKLAQVEVM